MPIVSWEETAAQSSFLAIVPPEPIATEIQQMQLAAAVSTSIAPHITVKSQPGLQGPRKWRDAVRNALLEECPVAIQLGATSWFGREYVVLQAHGELAKLHNRILDVLSEVGITERFEYDGDAYEPHLTLGAAWAGATVAQLETLAVAAKARTWPPFVASEVIEFHRAGYGQPYLAVEPYALGG